jgi:uncharacterized membrane protein YidH (DUF202 family)
MDKAAQIIRNVNREILNPLIALLFAAALAVFLWGLVEFIRSAESDQARTKGQQHMLWGIIGIAIMVAARAIIFVIVNTFGLPEPNL